MLIPPPPIRSSSGDQPAWVNITIAVIVALLFARGCQARAEILWQGNFEQPIGQQFPSDAPWDSGQATWTISKALAHSGKASVKCTINTSNGPAGVRWPLRNVPNSNSLPDAYYSCWYYLPSRFSASWVNAMQWKTTFSNGTSSNPTISVNLWTDHKGMHLDAVSYVDIHGKYGYSHEIAYADDILPIGQWFQIECYYRWSQSADGELTTWLNGKQLWSVKNIITQENVTPYKLPMQWSCNLYGEGTSPKSVSLSLDDLAISSTPLGH
jgi:Polysaccharide lyase